MRLLLTLILLLPIFSWASEPMGATGFEGGVVRLSDGHHSAIGSSWMFHTEYQVDPIVGFFGQGGKSAAQEGSHKFAQTSFNGGILIDVLPILEFRVGIATTILEIDDSLKSKKETELGPLAGAAVYIPVGVWKMGTTATVIKTGSLQSASMRLMLLMMF